MASVHQPVQVSGHGYSNPLAKILSGERS